MHKRGVVVVVGASLEGFLYHTIELCCEKEVGGEVEKKEGIVWE